MRCGIFILASLRAALTRAMTTTCAKTSTASAFTALAERKRSFLDAATADTAANAWTVAVGNSAGDLDSLASALAVAHARRPRGRASMQKRDGRGRGGAAAARLDVREEISRRPDRATIRAAAAATRNRPQKVIRVGRTARRFARPRPRRAIVHSVGRIARRFARSAAASRWRASTRGTWH